jgi:hypothetical protein
MPVKIIQGDLPEDVRYGPLSWDELSQVDPDVAASFKNTTGYFTGTPTLWQLIKEIRLLREAMAARAPAPASSGHDNKYHDFEPGFDRK